MSVLVGWYYFGIIVAPREMATIIQVDDHNPYGLGFIWFYFLAVAISIQVQVQTLFGV